MLLMRANMYCIDRYLITYTVHVHTHTIHIYLYMYVIYTYIMEREITDAVAVVAAVFFFTVNTV